MRFLELSGTPRTNGFEHGRIYKKEIRELYQIRSRILKQYFKLSPPEATLALERAIEGELDILKTFPTLWDEFSGIGEGSGLNEKELCLLNSYSDLRDFSIINDHSTPPVDEQGCSAIYYQQENQTISTQTWDMHSLAEPYTLVLDVSAHGLPRSKIFTVVGCLALCGINDAGVSVLINNLTSSVAQAGLMWPALIRGMLEQQSVNEALEFLRSHPPTSGRSFIIGQKSHGLMVETNGPGVEVVGELKQDGVLFHTNHALGSFKKTEIKQLKSITTQTRYQQLSQYFKSQENKKLTADQIRSDVLAGGACPAVNVLKPKIPEDTMTCGGMLVDYISKSIEFFSGPYRSQKSLILPMA